jgi:hypothetical protein
MGNADKEAAAMAIVSMPGVKFRRSGVWVRVVRVDSLELMANPVRAHSTALSPRSSIGLVARMSGASKPECLINLKEQAIAKSEGDTSKHVRDTELLRTALHSKQLAPQLLVSIPRNSE